MANKNSKQKVKPGKWWQIVAGILLTIFCAPLAFYLLTLPNSNWAFSLAFVIFGLPIMGGSLLIGAILSAIYIARYKPKGKRYLIPALVILLAIVAIFATLFYFVGQDLDAKTYENNIKKEQSKIKEKEEYVEGIFSGLHRDGRFNAREDHGGLASMGAEGFLYKGVEYVTVVYSNNEKFGDYQAKVNANLTKKGFTQDADSNGNAYYFIVNPSIYKKGSVVMRYSKSNESILIKYVLKETFECSTAYECYYLPGLAQSKELYKLENLNQLMLNSINANYSDIANSNKTAYEFYYP